jgi:hypothetical protein
VPQNPRFRLLPGYVDLDKASVAGPAKHGEAATQEIAALEAKVKANPDDFRAHQELDYTLARRGDFMRVVAMWDEFIHTHLKDWESAIRDATRACELGESEGCALAKRARSR